MRPGSPLVLRVRIRRELVNRARIVHPNNEGPHIPGISPFQGPHPKVTDKVRVFGRP